MQVEFQGGVIVIFDAIRGITIEAAFVADDHLIGMAAGKS